jgi:hypothetical protein
MKKLIPLVVVLVAFSTSSIMAQTATPSPSPVASASPAKHKAKAFPSGTVAPGGGPGMVWVNTETHVYHKEGSKWYGKTKQGKYLSEQDAIKEGDHAAKGEK